MAAVELAKALSDKLGRALDETLLWNCPNIDALVAYIVDFEQAVQTAEKSAISSQPARISGPDPSLEDEVAQLERELRLRS